MVEAASVIFCVLFGTISVWFSIVPSEPDVLTHLINTLKKVKSMH